MSRRTKWILIIAALIGLTFLAILRSDRRKSVEQQVLVADQLEFIGEDFPLDGGSRAFFFHLPHKQYLMLLVRHRRPAEEGGNPDFQEILVQGYRGAKTEVSAESALEKKLIALLRTAVINTNSGKRYAAPPTSERLQWAVERIQDRKSKW